MVLIGVVQIVVMRMWGLVSDFVGECWDKGFCTGCGLMQNVGVHKEHSPPTYALTKSRSLCQTLIAMFDIMGDGIYTLFYTLLKNTMRGDV